MKRLFERLSKLIVLSLFAILPATGLTALLGQNSFPSEADALCGAFPAPADDLGLKYTRALACLTQKRLDDAQRVFEELLSEVGDSPDLRVLFGLAFKSTEHWEEAAGEFEQAIKLDSACPKAHYYLGLTLILWKGVPASEAPKEHFQAELDLNSNQYLPTFYLGLIDTLKRNDEDALRYLRRAIEMEPSNPDPYLYLGQVLIRMEEPEEAVGALRRSIELTKDPSRNSYQAGNAEYILGQALLRSGNREEALEHIRKAQKLKQLHFAASQVEFQARKDTKVPALPSGMASHDFRDLKDVDPGLQWLLQPSSRMQPQKQLKQAAATGFQIIAGIAVDKNNFTRAADHLEQAVNLNPEEPELYFLLSRAYTLAGRPDRAREAYEKYLERKE